MAADVLQLCTMISSPAHRRNAHNSFLQISTFKKPQRIGQGLVVSMVFAPVQLSVSRGVLKS
jgi:hypothetical protein